MTESSSLKSNVATNRFDCSWSSCQKSFRRKTDLRRHYKIHTQERAYSCNIPGCGKRFIQSSALTIHTRTHTGEKPYRCSLCDKRFADSSSLARHRKIHLPRHRYLCPIDGCSKTLAQKYAMLQHQRKVHDDQGSECDTLSRCKSQNYPIKISPLPTQESDASTGFTPPPIRQYQQASLWEGLSMAATEDNPILPSSTIDSATINSAFSSPSACKFDCQLATDNNIMMQLAVFECWAPFDSSVAHNLMCFDYCFQEQWGAVSQGYAECQTNSGLSSSSFRFH